MKNLGKVSALFLILFFSLSFGQETKEDSVRVEKIGIEELPENIIVKGNVIEVYKWNDKNGINYFLSSAIGPNRKRFEDHEDEVSKQIFVEQYIDKNDNLQLLWNFELNRTCVMSLDLLVLPNSVYITDLDTNGVTETTFVYKTANRSDVSSADIELIMHENNKAYKLKGKTFIRYSKAQQDIDLTNYEFNCENLPNLDKPNDFSGAFLNDDDFEKAPGSFLQYAIDVWRKHIVENF